MMRLVTKQYYFTPNDFENYGIYNLIRNKVFSTLSSGKVSCARNMNNMLYFKLLEDYSEANHFR